MRFRIPLFAAALLSACERPGTPQPQGAATEAETDSARAAIAEGNALWVRFVNENKPDSLGTMYTENGVMMAPDVPMATGKENIVAQIRPFVLPGGTLTISSENVSVSGPIAVSRGTYTYTAPAQGGNPAVNARGKFLEHWHKVDGRWLIAENIWNNDAPAPQQPRP